MGRLKRHCIEPGCPNLATSTRCPAHDTANQAARWGYDYQRLRPAVLRRDGYECQVRLPGCTMTATTVDHIDPIGPRAVMWNLQAACGHCNSAKKDRSPA